MSGEESKGLGSGLEAPNTPFKERSLKGRHVVITGGTRGIGRELAKELAKRGAKVIICGRKEAGARAAAEEIAKEAGTETSGGAVEGFACDVGSLASIKAFVAAVAAKYKHLDVLINNAAIMPGFGEDPEKTPDELEEATFRINADGSHFMTKYCLPLLFAQPDPEAFERTVLYTSSAAGWLTEAAGGIGMVAYRATKAAQNGTMVGFASVYCRDISEDSWGLRGGDANKRLHRMATVHPGVVETALGIESAGNRGIATDDHEAFTATKKEIGAIPVSEGADTLLWLTAATNGVITNARHWYKRKEHSF